MCVTKKMSYISIHVPARGTTEPETLPVPAEVYFNPRPREGDDLTRLSYRLSLLISIHVPARGTTIDVFNADYFYMISIHVPARGTTRCLSTRKVMRGDFNPRPREGDDLKMSRARRFTTYFNPRPREGDDSMCTALTLSIFWISIHVPARGTTSDIPALPCGI